MLDTKGSADEEAAGTVVVAIGTLLRTLLALASLASIIGVVLFKLSRKSMSSLASALAFFFALFFLPLTRFLFLPRRFFF